MTTRETINGTLRVLGVAGFTGIVIVAPNATQGLSILLRRSAVKPDNYGRLLMELKRRGLVYIVAGDDNDYRYSLTPAGAHRLQKLGIDELNIPAPRKWDRKWRLVSFDIPVKQSRQRAYLTGHLQTLGFVMLQRSMWVHPFPCFEQIEKIAGYYNLLRYCSFMEIERLDSLSTKRLLKHFGQILT